LVVNGILGRVRGFEALPPLSSPSGILIVRPVPLKDNAERFSKRKLPGDFRGDRDLSIRSNSAFELDCLHPRIPLFTSHFRLRLGFLRLLNEAENVEMLDLPVGEEAINCVGLLREYLEDGVQAGQRQ
jgi:hypothetical protein